MSAKPTCCARIWRDSYRGYACGRTANYEHDGKAYCKTHHPPTVKAKDEARQAAWRAEWERKRALEALVASKRNEEQRRAALYDELLTELRRCIALIDGEVPSSAIAVIAKATGSAA